MTRTWWALALAAVFVAAAAADQDSTRGPRRPGRGPRPAGTQPSTEAAGAAPAEPGGPPWGSRFAHRLLRQSPEDRGPLRPGEEAELMSFAQQQMPRFHELMDRLHQRKPEQFRRRLAENAPRLRHLKRVFEYSPRIGRIIRAHADNLFNIQREARKLKATQPESPARARILQAIRPRVADNVRLEADALDALAEELAARRDTRIEERVAYLTGDGVDPAAEPEVLRSLIEAYQSAAAPQRDALRDQIRAAVAAQVDKELAALRQRATDMRSRADQEVEERMQRLTNPPPPRDEKHPSDR